jgi:AraC family transcriptional regulator
MMVGMGNSARDRLRALLDVVVDSVEQAGGLAGAELAGRAYLSRYHFDRLVAAAVGEPPGAFRRRLLLERAAYRLRATGDSIIEVALDAGYGSPEAFTRAFRRAYGRPPSALRGDPGARLLLPAPNGIHFYPPGGLRLPADARRAPMDITTTLLEHDNWLVGELIERADRLDGATLDRPITMSVDALDEGSSLRELLHTLVSTKERWTAAVDGQLPPGGDPLGSELPPSERTVAALRRRYAVAGPAFLGLAQRIRQRGDEGVTFIDATCEPPRTFSYGDMLAHVLNFSAYRRTLALAALHEYGVDDLGFGDPVGYAGTRR